MLLFKNIDACCVSNVGVKLVPLWYSKKKKWVFKVIMSYFYWGDVTAKPGIVNPAKNRYWIK